MNDIAIYGAGGYGREIACLINNKINSEVKEWNLVGFFDDDESLRGSNNGYGNIIGGLEELNNWDKPLGVVLAIANPSILKLLVSKIFNKNIYYPNLIELGTSFLDKESFNIGKGNIIGYGCRFSCRNSIGDFNIIVAETAFGHDAKIGNYNILFPEVRLSGAVEVGDENVFGGRSFIIQGVKIGSHTRIAPGAFVYKKTKDYFYIWVILRKRIICKY